MVLLAVFGFDLGWFPSGGANSPARCISSEWARILSLDFLWHLVLPAATLALYLQGLPLLLMRSNMLDVMQRGFHHHGAHEGAVRMAIVIRHAARNALLPVATAFALGFGASVGGNVVVETVFSWPGLGRLLVGAVASSDYPLAQGAFFLIAVVLVEHELHRRPALRRARSAGVPWQARLTPTLPRRRRRGALARAGAHAALAPMRDPLRGRRGRRSMLVFVLVAIFADAIATHDPLEILFRGRRQSAGERCRRAPITARHHQSRPRHLLPARHRHARRAAGRLDRGRRASR